MCVCWGGDHGDMAECVCVCGGGGHGDVAECVCVCVCVEAGSWAVARVGGSSQGEGRTTLGARPFFVKC